jgi:hypothetical protein
VSLITGAKREAGSRVILGLIAGRLLSRPMNSAQEIFGLAVGLDSRLQLTDTGQVAGALDGILPLFAGDKPFLNQSRIHQGWFLQPAATLSPDLAGGTRRDFGASAVRRVRLGSEGADSEKILGLGSSLDHDPNVGSSRLGVGADLQLGGWYSALNYYRPLDSGELAAAEALVRPSFALSARVEMPLTARTRLSVSADNWNDNRLESARWRQSASIEYDLTRWMTLEAGAQHSANGLLNPAAQLNLHTAPASYSRKQANLYRRF